MLDLFERWCEDDHVGDRHHFLDLKHRRRRTQIFDKGFKLA
jgi:hypothetical protein